MLICLPCNCQNTYQIRIIIFWRKKRFIWRHVPQTRSGMHVLNHKIYFCLSECRLAHSINSKGIYEPQFCSSSIKAVLGKTKNCKRKYGKRLLWLVLRPWLKSFYILTDNKFMLTYRSTLLSRSLRAWGWNQIMISTQSSQTIWSCVLEPDLTLLEAKLSNYGVIWFREASHQQLQSPQKAPLLQWKDQYMAQYIDCIYFYFAEIQGKSPTESPHQLSAQTSHSQAFTKDHEASMLTFVRVFQVNVVWIICQNVSACSAEPRDCFQSINLHLCTWIHTWVFIVAIKALILVQSHHWMDNNNRVSHIVYCVSLQWVSAVFQRVVSIISHAWLIGISPRESENWSQNWVNPSSTSCLFYTNNSVSISVKWSVECFLPMRPEIEQTGLD